MAKEKIDFSPFFERYQQLVRMVGEAFDRIKEENADLVKCKTEP